MSEKYILECDVVEENDTHYMKVKYDGVCTYNRIPKGCLKPYTDHFDDGKEHAQEVYRRLAKKHDGEMKEIFGDAYCENIILDFTVDEIEKKLDAWENLCVGDEVRSKYTNGLAVVTEVSGRKMFVLYYDGSCGDAYNKDDFVKTGRHFCEIEDVLGKMRG